MRRTSAGREFHCVGAQKEKQCRRTTLPGRGVYSEKLRQIGRN